MGQPSRYRTARLRAEARQSKVAAALKYWQQSHAGLRKDEGLTGQGEASKATNQSELQEKDSTAVPLYHPLRWRGAR
ncbi:hypothetical protein AZOA_07310 [Azoarcus sp. Aa7]|nr:hypothetical protein [Azoarcus sp. Aa7]